MNNEDNNIKRLHHHQSTHSRTLLHSGCLTSWWWAYQSHLAFRFLNLHGTNKILCRLSLSWDFRSPKFLQIFSCLLAGCTSLGHEHWVLKIALIRPLLIYIDRSIKHYNLVVFEDAISLIEAFSWYNHVFFIINRSLEVKVSIDCRLHLRNFHTIWRKNYSMC